MCSARGRVGSARDAVVGGSVRSQREWRALVQEDR
jgi:hypothetical protein